MITVVEINEPTPEQVAGEEPSNKIIIYWEGEYSTLIAPERLKLDFMLHFAIIFQDVAERAANGGGRGL